MTGRGVANVSFICHQFRQFVSFVYRQACLRYFAAFKKLIRNYSAGNKQKIGIISAMLHYPQLLILDEPFNFLDPSSQSIIKHLLKKYNEEHQATVIISSHNLNHTVDVCPRIALLEHGVIIRDIINEDNSAEKELEDYFNVEEE